MPSRDLPKRCGCGRVHTATGWPRLPLRGTRDGLEYRDCACGSTLAIRTGPVSLADLAADAREMRRAAERVEREIEIAQAGGDGAYSALLAARSALATVRQLGARLDPALQRAAAEARDALPIDRPVLIRRAAAGDGAALARLRGREDLAGLMLASLLRDGGEPEGVA